jgi:hypothetical protein
MFVLKQQPMYAIIQIEREEPGSQNRVLGMDGREEEWTELLPVRHDHAVPGPTKLEPSPGCGFTSDHRHPHHNASRSGVGGRAGRRPRPSHTEVSRQADRPDPDDQAGTPPPVESIKRPGRRRRRWPRAAPPSRRGGLSTFGSWHPH